MERPTDVTDVVCMHLTDGTILMAKLEGVSKVSSRVTNPLILTKFSSQYAAEVQLMLARYDNFNKDENDVEIFNTGVISRYVVDEETANFYNRFVDMYEFARNNPEEPLVDMPTKDEQPNVPPIASKLTNISTEHTKPVDINQLRRETIKLVYSKKDDE